MKRSLGPKILKKKKIDFEGSEESLQNLIAKILVLKKEYPDLKMTIIENSSEQNDSSVEKSDSDCEEHKETMEMQKDTFTDQEIKKDCKNSGTVGEEKLIECQIESLQKPLTLLNSPKESYFEMKEIFDANDICADESFKCEKTEEKGQYCQPDKETLLNIRNWCFLSLEKLSSLHDFYDLLENKQEYDDFKKEVEEDLNNYKIIYGDYIDEEIKELNDYISSL